jgi:menaquinone-9 beta-reductase
VSRSVTVLVVGAGPAGAVAAAWLARAGVTTLLVGPEAPEPDHDLLLGAPAREGLRSIGLTDTARTLAAETWFDPATPITLSDTEFAVESRRSLSARLVTHAIGSGADHVRGRVESLTAGPDGHVATIAGHPAVIARHVVIAVGAEGQLSPAGPASHGAGLGCARRFACPVTPSRVVVRLLPPADSDPRGQPACAWLAPGTDGTYTVTVTAVGDADPGALLERAVVALADVEPGLISAQPLGPIVSGPIDSGFSPDRATSDGALLVGAAAGLTNPFTGEGLSYAVQSGLIAARCVAADPDDPPAVGRAYARELGASFVGYFESARHAARRYHLAWRILAASAGNDGAFFAKGRQAILLPEGLTALTGTEPLRLPSRATLPMSPFLAACDEVAIATVRHEWPFIARLLVTGSTGTEHRLRPAVTFFAAVRSTGAMPSATHARLGAAIELACLGTLALLGPIAVPTRKRGVDWESTISILAGDYLLGQSSLLVAESHPEVSWAFADWLGELAALRAEAWTAHEPTGAEALFAALFEFPLRIGAELGGAPAETVRALRRYGTALGHAFLHVEDLLAVRGHRTRLDTTLRALLAGRLSALPRLLPHSTLSEETLRHVPELNSAAQTASIDEAVRARREAHHTLGSVPDPTARLILTTFVDTLVSPAAETRRSMGPPLRSC